MTPVQGPVRHPYPQSVDGLVRAQVILKHSVLYMGRETERWFAEKMWRGWRRLMIIPWRLPWE